MVPLRQVGQQQGSLLKAALQACCSRSFGAALHEAEVWKLKGITPSSEMYEELHRFHSKTEARERQCL